MGLSRRAFLAYLGIFGSTSAALGASDFDTDNLELVETDLPIKDLAQGFEDYRIAFLTDLHIGPCTDPDLTREAARMVSEARPDLVLLGGDYILRADQILDRLLFSLKYGQKCPDISDIYSEEQDLAEATYKVIADVVSTMRAPDGVIGVFGNHDLWVSPKHCHQELAKRQVKLLVNEYETITRGGDLLSIFGSDDYWAGRPKRPDFPTERRMVKLVLSHNPDYFSELLRMGKANFDAGVAGHTHGGQIKLPVVGAPFCNIRDDRFVEGLVRVSDAIFYTSRGVGTVGLPWRINCRPEVTIFRLRGA